MAKPFDLTDGSVTLDRRLDLIPSRDPRNAAFPMRLLLQPRPLRVWSWPNKVQLDQGDLGGCAAYASCHELSAVPIEQTDVGDELATSVYFSAQRRDGLPGGEYPGAFPRAGGTTLEAVAKDLKRRGRITGYYWAEGPHDVYQCVAWERPVVVGTPWTEAMMQPDANHMLHPDGRGLGGHAWLIRRIDPARRLLGMQNSWGRQWGDNGGAWMAFEDFERLWAQNGQAVVLVDNPTPPPEARVERPVGWIGWIKHLFARARTERNRRCGLTPLRFSR